MAIRAEESCSRLCQLKDVAMDTSIVRNLSLGEFMYIRCSLASLYIHYQVLLQYIEISRIHKHMYYIYKYIHM